MFWVGYVPPSDSDLPVRGPQWPVGYEYWVERLVDLIKRLVRGGPIRWLPMPRADELVRMVVEKVYKVIRWLAPRLRKLWVKLTTWLRQVNASGRRLVIPFMRGISVGRPFLCVAALASALREAAMHYAASALGDVDMSYLGNVSYNRCLLQAFSRLFDGEMHGRADWCPFGNPRTFRVLRQHVISRIQVPWFLPLSEALGAAIRMSLRFCARVSEWYVQIMSGPVGFALRQLAVLWAYMYGAAFPWDAPPHPKYLEARAIEGIAEAELPALLNTFDEVVKYCNRQMVAAMARMGIPTPPELVVLIPVPLYPGPLWVRIEGFEIDIPDLAEFGGAAAESLAAAGLHGLLGLLQRYYWI